MRNLGCFGASGSERFIKWVSEQMLRIPDAGTLTRLCR